jgi:hypothetical protein
MGDRIPWVIEEVSGDRFPDLESAQQEALKPLVAHLSSIMRELISQEKLIFRDGMISVNWESSQDDG